MALVKRTYSLPSETVQQFEDRVKPGDRSAMVARLLHEWVEAPKRQRIRQDLEECLREMAEEYLAVEREFHPLDEEVSRDL